MASATYRFSGPVEVPRVETRHRRIVTKIPVPESLEIFETLDRYESSAMHGQLPVVWDRAEGFQVHDPWGNTWIDFTSSIFVTNAGHGNPRIVEALREVLDRPLLHAYTYATRVRADYLRYLIASTPPQFEKAFLLSAGTEATECALKLMRTNGWKQGKRRPGILAFEGNWHGRTMGSQMISHNPEQKAWIGYQDPHIFHLPFPYPWREDAVRDPRAFFRTHMSELLQKEGLDPEKDLCGVMLETFQGWGALFYPPEFVQEAAAFARARGMLVAFDEMQAGFGRTGKLFGYMHYGVEPDLLCCGKGASSSLPLSIVLGSQRVMDLPEVGSMSSTHSANPASCAAGLANLRALIEEGMIENARVLGEVFHARLNEIRGRFPGHIRHVLGRGLVAGVHFADPNGKVDSVLASRVCEKALRKGLLLVHTGRESIKMGPPLVITEEGLMEGLEVFEESVAEGISEAGR
ncbi:MAG: aspartate aminotransferase family protein [Candidatus Latescibacteria bacterium]|nr:aspartate aminotransferase family protein [Candidatus Latescibacterota bacterium]